VQEVLHPAAAAAKPAIVTRHIACFQCGTLLDPPAAAQSTMCKRCSSYVDLADYQIAQTVSKNFRTHGRLVVEEKGFVLNTDAVVGEALVKGRVIGKLKAERTLEIHSSARIQGAISGGVLVIPRGHHFRWPEVLHVSGAEISGELVGKLSSTGSVVLRSAARFLVMCIAHT
jgi:cytoskeletal protein CcmA (bactofilin family)